MPFALSKVQCNRNERFRVFTERRTEQQWIPLNCDVPARYHFNVELYSRFSAMGRKRTKCTRDRMRQQKKLIKKEHFHNLKLFLCFVFSVRSRSSVRLSSLFYCCAIKFHCSEKRAFKSKRNPRISPDTTGECADALVCD